MKFQYKSEADAKRELLLDEGEYDFEIVKAEEKQSKKGNDMIVATLRIFSESGDRFVTDYLMEVMRFKLIHLTACVGLSARYEAGELTAEELIGRTGKVHLVVEQQDGYMPKNVVKDYIVSDTGKEAAPIKPAPIARTAAMDANEPPF